MKQSYMLQLQLCDHTLSLSHTHTHTHTHIQWTPKIRYRQAKEIKGALASSEM